MPIQLHAPQFVSPLRAPGQTIDPAQTALKGLAKAAKSDRLCVYQPSQHAHIATDVSKADFSRLMKLDLGKARFASDDEASFAAARSILQHAGVPDAEHFTVRLTLDLARRVGAGELTPEVAGLLGRAHGTAEYAALQALAVQAPHAAQLLAVAQQADPPLAAVSAGQLHALRELASFAPARADALAQAVLEHLADPAQAMPDVDAGLVRAGIEAGNDAAAHQDAFGLQDGGAARKTALAQNLARMITGADGSLEAARLDQAIEQLGSPPAPQTAHTRLAIRQLERLRDDAGFAAQWQSIGAPASPDGPAADLLRATLGLPPGQPVTQAHARLAALTALTALLSDLRQSSVGSCFGTAVAIMVHDTQPDRFLADLKSMIEDGGFTRRLEGQDVFVSISGRVGTRELQQTVQLDRRGNLVAAGGKPVAPPAPLHQAPAMRAALAALGVAPQDMAGTLEAARRRLPGSATLTPEALLRQVALRQAGLDEAHMATVARIRGLEGRMGELSIAMRNGDPAATRRFATLQKEHDAAFKSIGRYFHTEAMQAFESAMNRAVDAFQGQMDNRLLRGWEYTLSSVLEKGEGVKVRKEAYDALMGEATPNHGADPARMGLDRYASHHLLESRQVKLRDGSLGPVMGTVYQARTDRGMPALPPLQVDDADRAGFDPNAPGHAPSDETVFLHKFNSTVLQRFEMQFKGRLAVQYDPSAMGSGEIAADGSSDRGGFVLYDTAGGADPSEWIRLDTPQAYKRLASSVMRDVSRDVAQQMAPRDVHPAMHAFLAQAGEQVALHAEAEAFTQLMDERSAQRTALRKDDNPRPWQPFSGGQTHVAGRYFGHDAPAQTDIGRYPDGFLRNLVKQLQDMGEPLRAQLAQHGEDFGIPTNTSTHAFLARPGHPTLAGALDAPDVAAWVRDTLETPGTAQARQPLDVAAQRRVVDALLQHLKLAADGPDQARLVAALQDGKTPQELAAWLKTELAAHPPAPYAELDDQARDKLLELMVVKHLSPAPPRVVVADMNWSHQGLRVELSAIFNPVSGTIEPWFTGEDGGMLGAKAKPGGEWFSWTMMTDPAQHGYA